MKKCKYCSKEFKPKNPKGIFCSDNCRVYFNRRKGNFKKKTKEQNDEQEEKKSTTSIAKHHLWKQGDPSEGSNAFFLRYGAFSYDEL